MHTKPFPLAIYILQLFIWLKNRQNVIENCKNHPASGGSAPRRLCDMVSCIGLLSTGPKLDNFCAKNLLMVQALSLSKIMSVILVASKPADRFSTRLFEPHTQQAQKHC